MNSFFFGFGDELVKRAQEGPGYGGMAALGAAYEGLPKALLGAVIGALVGKGRRGKAALLGGAVGGALGVAKGSTLGLAAADEMQQQPQSEWPGFPDPNRKMEI